MKLLLDTNIVSEANRPQGHPAIRAALERCADDDLFLSVITVGEIAKGIASLDPSRRRADLEQWLAHLQQHFSERVLPVDH